MRSPAGWMAALALLGVSPFVQAQLVQYTYAGTVEAGEDYTGFFTGTVGADLSGYAYTATFQLDLDHGVSDNGLTYLQIIGGSADGISSTPVVNSILTINGRSASIGGDYYAVVNSPENGGQLVNSVSAVESQSSLSQQVFSIYLPYSLSIPVSLYTVQPTDQTGGAFSIYNRSGTGISYPVAIGYLVPATLSITLPSGYLPTATPVVAGVHGSNGWYVSAASVVWAVTGVPSPTTSGCATVTVTDTTGVRYGCSATNPLGTASAAVTIRQDTVAPAVTITSPVQGKTYRLNSVIPAAYSCTDATSGVASCTGTVARRADINTATRGTFPFSVVAVDRAGNKTTRTVTYSVR